MSTTITSDDPIVTGTAPVAGMRGAFQKSHIKHYLSANTDFSQAFEGGTLHESAFGRAHEASNRALGIAKADDLGGFQGRRSLDTARDIESRMESIKEWKNSVNDSRAEGATSRNLRDAERFIQNEERDLGRIGKNVLRDIAEGEAKHLDAKAKLITERTKLLAEIDKEYFAEQAKVLRDPAKKALLEKNRNALKNFVEKQFNERIDLHEDHLARFKNIVEDVESHTNLKYSDFKKSATAVVEGEKAAPGVTSEATKAAGAVSHMKGTGIGAVVGAGAGYAFGSDDNKTASTVIGAGAGAISGNLISRLFSKSTSAVGAFLHGPQASKLIGTAARGL